jgi:hypothetical protein
MIITRQKDFKYLLDKLDYGPVFLIGCSECATLCRTGGEEEIKKFKECLNKNNVITTGWVILEPACHFLNGKKLLRNHLEEIGKAKKVIVFACGNGVQTVSEIINEKDVISGTDTLFLGEIRRLGDFEKRCELCGECIQDSFEGFCPLSRCPKSMLNGPCGGAVEGRCEIDNDLDCVWDRIFQRFKEKGETRRLMNIQRPKDWSRSTEFRRVLFYDQEK